MNFREELTVLVEKYDAVLTCGECGQDMDIITFSKSEIKRDPKISDFVQWECGECGYLTPIRRGS